MPSPPGLEYGQYYHIYNRGNNRVDIFYEDRNYRHFLDLYARYVTPVVDTYAYCLLRNHFHLLVRIKPVVEQEPTATGKPVRPSQQLSNLFNAYAKAINKAYARTGSLFENPFGRIPVADEAHFWRLVTYIHHNPQKHGFVSDLADWPYSSYHAILSAKPTRVQREVVLDWFGGPDGFRAAHGRTIDERAIAAWIGEDL